MQLVGYFVFVSYFAALNNNYDLTMNSEKWSRLPKVKKIPRIEELEVLFADIKRIIYI